MVETLIFSVPAVLLGFLMGTMLGMSLMRSKSRQVSAKFDEQKAVIEQQAKQIWLQADHIHSLEIEKVQQTAWRRPEDQQLHEKLARMDAEKVRAVA
jgi:hypothetical protein